MQCKNGGWAASTKTTRKMIFQYIPFADHNAMLDPPTVDITGRMLEMLAHYGYTRRDKRVEKAIQFVLKEQESDGSWFGRWGVNYLYGTFLVLRGLEAMGMWNHEPAIQQAAEWIRMVQNADGGWGETCSSYDDPDRCVASGQARHRRRHGRFLDLLAAGDTRSDSVAKGIRWLVTKQRKMEAGTSWQPNATAKLYTGTGFPRVFYLAYHLYRDYFPLLALTTYKRFGDDEEGSGTQASSIELSALSSSANSTDDEIVEREETFAKEEAHQRRWQYQSHRPGRSQRMF